VNLLLEVTNGLRGVVVYVFEFETEFLGLLHSALAEFSMGGPHLLLILEDLVSQLLDVVLGSLISQALKSDEFSVLLGDFIQELGLPFEMLAPRENVEEQLGVLWICQVWRAPDQLSVCLVADVLQEVFTATIGRRKNFCICIFRLQLAFERVLRILAGITIIHIGIVVPIERRRLLAMEVESVCISSWRFSVQRLHLRFGHR